MLVSILCLACKLAISDGDDSVHRMTRSRQVAPGCFRAWLETVEALQVGDN